MKINNLKLSQIFGFLLSIFFLLPLVSNLDAKQQIKQNSADYLLFPGSIRDKTKDLESLKNTNGKYPEDIDLFSNRQFTKRLKSLLGKKNYKALRHNWGVERPIIIDSNTFIARGCAPGKCASYNYIIIYDFDNDKMYCGYNDNGRIQKFNEDGSTPTVIANWAANYNYQD